MINSKWCLILRFKNIKKKENYEKIKNIAIKEKILISPEIINIILKYSKGINSSIDLLQLYHNNPESILLNEDIYDKLKDLVLSRNPKNIPKINSLLFDLFIMNVDIRYIMKKIMNLLIKETNDTEKKKIM